MSDPSLLSHYGAPARFVVGGHQRGLHNLAPMGAGRFEYRLGLTLPGPLPNARLCTLGRVALEPAVTQRYGPMDSTVNMPLATAAFSVGAGFVRRLLSDRALERDLGRLRAASFDLKIEAMPGGQGHRVMLHAGPVTDGVALAEIAANVGRAITAMLLDIVQNGEAFPDARARFDDGAVDEPPDNRLERIADQVVAQAHWLTANVHRTGQHLEGRLALDEGGLGLDGTMRLFWSSPEVLAINLSLEAALPDTEHDSCRIEPQKGLRGLLLTPFEHKSGVARVDDAFLLLGDETAARRWGSALATRLLRLATGDVKLAIDADRLLLTLTDVPTPPPMLGHVIDDALHLWREVALIRAGAIAPPDPFAQD